MDAAEYKHVVLGLIFLKYISDSFGEVHRELENLINSISITHKSYLLMRKLFPGITVGEYKFLLTGIASGLFLGEHAKSHHERPTTKTTDDILRIAEKGTSELIERGAKVKRDKKRQSRSNTPYGGIPLRI